MSYEVNVDLQGQEDLIKRQVAMSVVSELKEILIVDNDIRTVLKNSLDEYVNRDATVSNLGKNVNTDENDYGRIELEVEEETTEDTILTVRLTNNNYPPIFWDKDLDLRLTPIYYDTDMTITINIWLKSKTELNRISNRLKNKVIASRTANYHTLKYRYNLNYSIGKLFLNIYEKKKVNENDIDESFEDWLFRISSGSLTLATNLSGNPEKVELAVHEEQCKVVGYFDSELLNITPEFDEEYNSYKISLSYKLTYNKHFMFRLRYPFIVCNQLLGKDYVIFKDYYDKYPCNHVGQTLLHYYESQFIESKFLYGAKLKPLEKVVKIPSYDNWELPKGNPFLIPLMTVLTTINKDDKKSLFNLQELPGIVINPKLIEFFKKEHNYMNKVLGSAFVLELYEDDEMLPETYLEIDEDLNLKATKDLKICKTYRVVLKMVYNINKILFGGLDRLLNNPEIIIIMSEILNLRDLNHLQEILYSYDEYREKYKIEQVFNVNAFCLFKG